MRKAAGPDPGKEAGENQQKEDERKEPTHEALERLAADISRHWLGNYTGLESLPGIVGTAMIGVGAGNGDKYSCQDVSPVRLERTRTVDDSGSVGHSIPDDHHARQMGP